MAAPRPLRTSPTLNHTGQAVHTGGPPGPQVHALRAERTPTIRTHPPAPQAPHSGGDTRQRHQTCCGGHAPPHTLRKRPRTWQPGQSHRGTLPTTREHAPQGQRILGTGGTQRVPSLRQRSLTCWGHLARSATPATFSTVSGTFLWSKQLCHLPVRS